jgi:biopolymer transport protein ExbD
MALAQLLGEVTQRRSLVFALTPLADIMFQLLIFFMLTTSIVPYALLPLGGAAPQTQTPLPGLTDAPRAGSAAWHVSAGRIRGGDASIDIADLPLALDQLREVDIAEIVLFTTPDATVQDLASVLDHMQAAGLKRVRLIARPGGGGG